MNNEVTMLDYINLTREVLLRNIDNRKELVGPLVKEYIDGGYKGLTMIACGSSYNASLSARYFLRKYLKEEISLIAPFTYMYHESEFHEGTMLINVSQSGCSTNIIDCAKFEKKQGHKVISLVGREDADLKNYSDLTLNWGIETEKIGYSTMGVVTLSGFMMLFGVEVAYQTNKISKQEYDLVINDMKKAMMLHKEVTENTIKMFEDHKDRFIDINRVYLVSSGYNIATAIEGSLKIAETSCITCVGAEVEEYLHGPMYPIGEDTLLIFIDNNDDPSSKRILEVAKSNLEITGKNLIITNSKEFDDEICIRTSTETMPEVSCLYKLACVETLAYLRTEATNKYKPHENLLKYRKKYSGMTKSRTNLVLDMQGVNKA